MRISDLVNKSLNPVSRSRNIVPAKPGILVKNDMERIHLNSKLQEHIPCCKK